MNFFNNISKKWYQDKDIEERKKAFDKIKNKTDKYIPIIIQEFSKNVFKCEKKMFKF